MVCLLAFRLVISDFFGLSIFLFCLDLDQVMNFCVKVGQIYMTH